MGDFKWPTWEAAKEIADLLPGEKSGDAKGGKVDDPKCETCGKPMDEQESKKGW